MQQNRCVVKNFSSIDSALYLYIDERKKINRWMAIYIYLGLPWENDSYALVRYYYCPIGYPDWAKRGCYYYCYYSAVL